MDRCLAPEIPATVRVHDVPVVRATEESLRGYGKLVDGGKGLYIHPNIWHEAVFPIAERARFHDEQGKVHARVSCNFAQEFGTLLGVPLVLA